MTFEIAYSTLAPIVLVTRLLRILSMPSTSGPSVRDIFLFQVPLKETTLTQPFFSNALPSDAASCPPVYLKKTTHYSSRAYSAYTFTLFRYLYMRRYTSKSSVSALVDIMSIFVFVSPMPAILYRHNSAIQYFQSRSERTGTYNQLYFLLYM